MVMNRRKFLKSTLEMAAVAAAVALDIKPANASIYSVTVLAITFPKANQDPVLKQFPYKSIWGYLAADSLWLCNRAGEVYVLDEHCPHCRARLHWQAAGHQFGCPVCGSRFDLSGDYAGGPAAYGMWRHWIEVADREGNFLADYKTDRPIRLTRNAYSVRIDVTVVTYGHSRLN